MAQEYYELQKITESSENNSESSAPQSCGVQNSATAILRGSKSSEYVLIPVKEREQNLQVNYADFGYHRSDYEAPVPQSDKVIE